MGGDAPEGKGPQRRPQRRLGRRLEEVAKAVGGGYCRLQMPLRLALGVRGRYLTPAPPVAEGRVPPARPRAGGWDHRVSGGSYPAHGGAAAPEPTRGEGGGSPGPGGGGGKGHPRRGSLSNTPQPHKPLPWAAAVVCVPLHFRLFGVMSGPQYRSGTPSPLQGSESHANTRTRSCAVQTISASRRSL